MINCKEASLLSTKKAEGMISFKERLLLFFHVKMCAMCKLFDKQNKFLSNHAKASVRKDALLNSEIMLTDDDKRRMNEQIGKD